MLIQARKLISRLGVALFALFALPGLVYAQWNLVNNVPAGTSPSTCLLLTDGTVMCQATEGGKSWLRLTPDNTGSYENGAWTSFDDAPMGTDSTVVNGVACNPCQWAPTYYASAVLPDGRVVLIGGEYNTNSTGSRPSWTNTGFLFDPTMASGHQWSAQLTQPFGYFTRGNGDMVGCIGDAQSVITQTGTMLIATICGSQIASFNPSTLTFTQLAAPAAPKNDGNDEENWTILPNGTIFVVDSGKANLFEIYDPVANTWIQPTPNTTGGVTLPDVNSGCNSTELGPAVALPNGTIIQFSGNPSGQNAVYTIATNTWTAGPTFPNNDSVADGPASLLVNGHVLVMASPACVQTSPGPPPMYSVFNTPSHFYEFDGTNLNDVTPSMPAVNGPNAPNLESFFGRMLLLPSGHVLVTFRGDSPTQVWSYTPAGGPLDAWRPGITTAPSVIGQGQTYSISGTMFNGFSQGAGYGDDAQVATNWPLVRITNNGSSHVRYARTHDHSRMGVEAVGDTEIISTNFDVPANLELGASTLVVVTNGIASAPVNISVELPTTLAFTGTSAASSDFADAATVQAQLTSRGSPLQNETVTFALGSGSGSETCSMMTDTTGTATCQITPNQQAGSYTLTATFGGDATYAGSSASTSFTILLEDTTTVLSSSVNPSIVGQSVTLTATVSGDGGTPTGTVTFSDGATSLGNRMLSSGQAAFTTSSLSVGSHAMTAQYGGDSYFASSSGSLTQQVEYAICPLYDQTRSVKTGAAYPIKLELCDTNGNDVSSSAVVVHAVSVTLVSTGVPGTLEDTGNANPDNDFRFDSTLGTAGGYIFNLGTAGLSGTYNLNFTAGNDPIQHSVQFEVHQ